jgi:hypothetical protein
VSETAQAPLLREWYALQSYVPANPKHKPRFLVCQADELQRVVGRITTARSREEKAERIHWKILQPAPLASREEAEQLAEGTKALLLLEQPDLFAPRLGGPKVNLPCGCIVSYDGRREKRCATAQQLKEARDKTLDLGDYDPADSLLWHLMPGWDALEQLRRGGR